MSFQQSKTTTNRQLKVGENIKRALSTILMSDINDPVLDKMSITISEVKMSPDLRVANAYLLPLIGNAYNNKEFLSLMKEFIPQIRYSLAKKVQLRYVPEIRFILDSTFEQVANLELLLKK